MVYLDQLGSFQRVMPMGRNLLHNGYRMMETRYTSSWLKEEHPWPRRRSSTSTIWRLHPFIPSFHILRNSRVHRCPWRCHHYGHSGSTRYETWQTPGSHQTHGPKHFWELPLAPVDQAQPLLLIRSDILRTTKQTWCHLHSAVASKTRPVCLGLQKRLRVVRYSSFLPF